MHFLTIVLRIVNRNLPDCQVYIYLNDAFALFLRLLNHVSPEESPQAKKDYDKNMKKYHGLLKKQEQLLRGTG